MTLKELYGIKAAELFLGMVSVFNIVKNLPNILVIDDDQRTLLRTLLVQFLENSDLRVQAAANAAEARSYLASQSLMF